MQGIPKNFNREEQKKSFIGEALSRDKSVEGILKWMDFLIESIPRDIKGPLGPIGVEIAKEIKEEYKNKKLTNDELTIMYYEYTHIPMPRPLQIKFGFIKEK